MVVTYCKKCVIPSTRPDIFFYKNGVCSACHNSLQKKIIDWKKRKKLFSKLVNKYKKLSKNNNYDCIVPVSGGKDSIYQVYMMKKIYKLRTLAITWKPLIRTYRGYENLDALKKIGVDHIDFSTNPKVISEIAKKAFISFGDCSYIDHLCIFNTIPNLALKLKIPLVIWGENFYFEYGGKTNKSLSDHQSEKILDEHHILKKTKTENWISKNISNSDIASFATPNYKELKKIKYKPIYLGHYFNWDIKKNTQISKKCGFKERKEGPIMGLYKESDLDCNNIAIHHYFKWLKFGFNRVSDNSSNEIRKGRLTREKAILLVRKKDGLKPPKEFIKKFCRSVEITEEYFWKICDKFRNRNIWKKNKYNKWELKKFIDGKKLVDNFGYTKLSKEEKILNSGLY
jgi:N-acetyl sugar amidotransferase